MKLKLALAALLVIAALTVSGCCCCVIPTHRVYYRIPYMAYHLVPIKITTTAMPILPQPDQK